MFRILCIRSRDSTICREKGIRVQLPAVVRNFIYTARRLDVGPTLPHFLHSFISAVTATISTNMLPCKLLRCWYDYV